MWLCYDCIKKGDKVTRSTSHGHCEACDKIGACYDVVNREPISLGDFLKPTIGHSTDKGTAVITKNKEELKEIYRNVTESVLVACPTYRGKSYALEAYIRAYNDFVFPYRALFMVDNTGDTLKYYEHLKKLNVPCEHINPTLSFQETFAMSWKRILQKAKEGKHKWVMSIEQDNICPPLTLDIMLNVAGFCNAVHVAHSYPWHKCQSDKGVFTGLGCNLILTELLDKIFARPKWYTDAFEAELTEYPKINGLVSLDVYNLIDVRHVDDEQGIEYYHFKKESIPELTHGVVKEKKPIQYNNLPEKGAEK